MNDFAFLLIRTGYSDAVILYMSFGCLENTKEIWTAILAGRRRHRG
jgi:hypothetical protein